MDYDSCIYQEVYEILSLMDKKTVMKIPLEILQTIKENRNKEYVTQIDKNDIFNIENLNEDTIKLLSWIDLNYWINTEKYENIKKISVNQMVLNELSKKEQFENTTIFNKKENNKNIISQNIIDNNGVKEKQKLKKIYDKNENVYQIKLREKYNSDNLFKNQKEDLKNNEQENTDENIHEISLVEYKENFFTKFKNFILKLLHIKS